MMKKRWTEQEKEVLINQYPYKKTDELCILLNKKAKGIQMKAFRMNLEKIVHGNTGKKQSEKTILKKTEKLKGKKRSELSIKRYSESKKGDRNPMKREDVKKRRVESFKKNNRNKGSNNSSKRPEIRKKLSEGKMGYKNPNYGKHTWNSNKNHLDDNRILNGEAHPSWKGGISYKPYCPKFNNDLKENIKKRDDYQCQYPTCLCTQIESMIRYKSCLHVHHIHYDKENCYPDLITLCTKHNSSANFNREYHECLFMDILKERNLLNWRN